MALPVKQSYQAEGLSPSYPTVAELRNKPSMFARLLYQGTELSQFSPNLKNDIYLNKAVEFASVASEFTMNWQFTSTMDLTFVTSPNTGCDFQFIYQKETRHYSLTHANLNNICADTTSAEGLLFTIEKQGITHLLGFIVDDNYLYPLYPQVLAEQVATTTAKISFNHVQQQCNAQDYANCSQVNSGDTLTVDDSLIGSEFEIFWFKANEAEFQKELLGRTIYTTEPTNNDIVLKKGTDYKVQDSDAGYYLRAVAKIKRWQYPGRSDFDSSGKRFCIKFIR